MATLKIKDLKKKFKQTEVLKGIQVKSSFKIDRSMQVQNSMFLILI